MVAMLKPSFWEQQSDDAFHDSLLGWQVDCKSLEGSYAVVAACIDCCGRGCVDIHPCPSTKASRPGRV